MRNDELRPNIQCRRRSSLHPAANLEELKSSLDGASAEDKEAIESQISTLEYAISNEIPLSSGFTDDLKLA